MHQLPAKREIAPERQQVCAPCAPSCRMRAKRRGRASDALTPGRRRVGRMLQICVKRDPAPSPHRRSCRCMDACVGAKIPGRGGERGGRGVASSEGEGWGR